MRLNEATYVDEAERVMKELESRSNKDKQNKPIMVTTTKIRNLLSMTMDIYNQVLAHKEDKLSEEINGQIEYLRVRFIYECGREPQVKRFVQTAGILDILKEINGSKKNYLIYTHYMEALVAFRKFYWDDKDI